MISALIWLRSLASRFESGSISPFRAHIADQNGVIRCEPDQEPSAEDIMKMDWLCDNVDGSIPEYDELIPQSKGLVQLLGLHRDAILPKKGEIR